VTKDKIIKLIKLAVISIAFGRHDFGVKILLDLEDMGVDFYKLKLDCPNGYISSLVNLLEKNKRGSKI